MARTLYPDWLLAMPRYQHRSWDAAHARWRYQYGSTYDGGAGRRHFALPTSDRGHRHARPEYSQWHQAGSVTTTDEPDAEDAPRQLGEGVWYAHSDQITPTPLGTGILLTSIQHAGKPVRVSATRPYDLSDPEQDPEAMLASFTDACQHMVPGIPAPDAIRGALMQHGFDAITWRGPDDTTYAMAIKPDMLTPAGAMQKGKVLHPGVRGGKGYYDHHGEWQYGEHPAGRPSHVSDHPAGAGPTKIGLPAAPKSKLPYKMGPRMDGDRRIMYHPEAANEIVGAVEKHPQMPGKWQARHWETGTVLPPFKSEQNARDALWTHHLMHHDAFVRDHPDRFRKPSDRKSAPEPKTRPESEPKSQHKPKPVPAPSAPHPTQQQPSAMSLMPSNDWAGEINKAVPGTIQMQERGIFTDVSVHFGQHDDGVANIYTGILVRHDDGTFGYKNSQFDRKNDQGAYATQGEALQALLKQRENDNYLGIGEHLYALRKQHGIGADPETVAQTDELLKKVQKRTMGMLHTQGDIYHPAVRTNLKYLQDCFTDQGLNALSDNGVTIWVSDTNVAETDHLNRLLQGKPRGNGQVDDWKDVDGIYSQDDHQLAAGWCPGRDWGQNSHRVLVHEIGHAIAYTRGYAHSRELAEHHRRLYSKVSPYEQTGGPGAEYGANEMFAIGMECLTIGRKWAVRCYDEPYVAWLEQIAKQEGVKVKPASAMQKGKVLHPGVRGGKGYYDHHGEWQYGEHPTGRTSHISAHPAVGNPIHIGLPVPPKPKLPYKLSGRSDIGSRTMHHPDAHMGMVGVVEKHPQMPGKWQARHWETGATLPPFGSEEGARDALWTHHLMYHDAFVRDHPDLFEKKTKTNRKTAPKAEPKAEPKAKVSAQQQQQPAAPVPTSSDWMGEINRAMPDKIRVRNYSTKAADINVQLMGRGDGVRSARAGVVVKKDDGTFTWREYESDRKDNGSYATQGDAVQACLRQREDDNVLGLGQLLYNLRQKHGIGADPQTVAQTDALLKKVQKRAMGMLHTQGDIYHPAVRTALKHLQDCFTDQALNKLSGNGVTIWVSDTNAADTDQLDWLLQSKPMGNGQADSWRDVDGVYAHGQRKVAAGWSPGRDWNGKSTRVLVHEIGHAIAYTRGYAHSQELVEHHQRLHDKVSPYEQTGGPSGHFGANEMFAIGMECMTISRKLAVKRYDEPYVAWLEQIAKQEGVKVKP